MNRVSHFAKHFKCPICLRPQRMVRHKSVKIWCCTGCNGNFAPKELGPPCKPKPTKTTPAKAPPKRTNSPLVDFNKCKCPNCGIRGQLLPHVRVPGTFVCNYCTEPCSYQDLLDTDHSVGYPPEPAEPVPAPTILDEWLGGL